MLAGSGRRHGARGYDTASLLVSSRRRGGADENPNIVISFSTSLDLLGKPS